jgi:hypothetical protein
MVKRVKIVQGKYADGTNQNVDDSLPKKVFDTIEDITMSDIKTITHSVLGSGYGSSMIVWEGTSTTTTTTTSTTSTSTTAP